MTGPLLVTAWLGSGLAGDPPQLDGLLEWRLSAFDPRYRERQRQGLPHERVQRSAPAPPQARIPIPILRARIGPWSIACCSAPILVGPCLDTRTWFVKAMRSDRAVEVVSERDWRVVNTTGGWTKNYRLPCRVRQVPCVAWFCRGNARNLRKSLREVWAIGDGIAHGFGRIRRWLVEPAPDWCWFGECEGRPYLMRNLPQIEEGVLPLPPGLAGVRRHFGACTPPYWHPERFTEILTPCWQLGSLSIPESDGEGTRAVLHGPLRCGR